MYAFDVRTEKRILLAFIREHWSDFKLAEVYAFAEDGKMIYSNFCSCLLGVTLTDRLHSEWSECPNRRHLFSHNHYAEAKKLPNSSAAEDAFLCIEDFEKDTSRPIFLRLLRAEMRLRAWKSLRIQAKEECHDSALPLHP